MRAYTSLLDLFLNQYALHGFIFDNTITSIIMRKVDQVEESYNC